MSDNNENHNDDGHDDMSWKKLFVCLDCQVNTSDINEYYMVHNHIWNRIVPEGSGMLCIGCLETRLGRELNFGDFTDALINHPDGAFLKPHSERLYHRLTSYQQVGFDFTSAIRAIMNLPVDTIAPNEIMRDAQ